MVFLAPVREHRPFNVVILCAMVCTNSHRPSKDLRRTVEDAVHSLSTLVRAHFGPKEQARVSINPPVDGKTPRSKFLVGVDVPQPVNASDAVHSSVRNPSQLVKVIWCAGYNARQ